MNNIAIDSKENLKTLIKGVPLWINEYLEEEGYRSFGHLYPSRDLSKLFVASSVPLLFRWKITLK